MRSPIRAIPGYEVVGVCTRHIDKVKIPEALSKAKKFSDYDTALAELKPDVVSVNTLPDTHADFSIKAMKAGAHVFVEKPLALTVESAQEVIDTAKRLKKKLVIGYILRVSPVVDQIHRDRAAARNAAGVPHEPEPAVEWRNLGLAQAVDGFLSAIVDCGVHYVE